MLWTRRAAVAGLVTAGFATIGHAVHAAEPAAYPHRVVTLVTHSSPGGGSDVFLRQAIGNGYIDQFLAPNETGIIRNMLTGLLLMLLVIFRPQGVIGDKDEVAVSVRR